MFTQALTTTQVVCVINFAASFQYIRRYDALLFYLLVLGSVFLTNTLGKLDGGFVYLLLAIVMAACICVCTNALRGRVSASVPLCIYDVHTSALTRLMRISILLFGILFATVLRFETVESDDDRVLHAIDSVAVLVALWLVLFIAYWCDAQSSKRRGRIVYDDDTPTTHAYFALVCAIFVLINLLFIMQSARERWALLLAILAVCLTRAGFVRYAILQFNQTRKKIAAVSNKND